MKTSKISAAMHVHSAWSYDASTSILDLRRILSKIGANVILMTEHDRGFNQDRFLKFCAECRAACDYRMLVIPGIEYSCPANKIHILVWGVDYFLGENLLVQDLLEKVSAANGVAILAHPQRREVWKDFHQDWASLLDGVEVWNRKSDGLAPFSKALAIASDHHLKPFFGIDYHRSKQLYPLLNITTRHLPDQPINEAEVLAALKAGSLAPYAFGIPTFKQGKFDLKLLKIFRIVETCRLLATRLRSYTIRNGGLRNLIR